MKQLRLARPVRDEAHRTRGRNRIVRHFEPGSSTAVPLNVTYRLGKIREPGLLKVNSRRKDQSKECFYQINRRLR